jgi:uncharacterized protein YbjT (DUF2867 family)
MKILLFGATGMVGQGVLRECLLDPNVERVLAVGRHKTGQNHEKLRDLAVADIFELSSIELELVGLDACFFCLGVSSAGMSEQDYTRMTYDLTIAAAQVLAKLNPSMTFVYVSGTGTDSTERGKTMWARVKGRTENALLALPFKAKYMFRPAFIQPLHGIKSRTKLYRAGYALTMPLLPLLKMLFPDFVTTTEKVAKAMLRVAKNGAPKAILENRDINELAAGA